MGKPLTVLAPSQLSRGDLGAYGEGKVPLWMYPQASESGNFASSAIYFVKENFGIWTMINDTS